VPLDPDFLQPGGALASPALRRALDRLGLAEGMAPGSRIGPYRVVSQIGRGGMAVVYLAERDDGEFEQSVALKLVRPDTESALARELLRHERQILANLQHPNIARLLDGGRCDDGTLWFALELVHGTRIDRYCRDRRLPLDARLKLFMQVCEAVQFAHSRLLIHRDIKPANILVTHDENVKLLDFGIAQLLAPDSPSPLAARALTPGYASPEQLRAGNLTTASDIHQLGGLLQSMLRSDAPDAARDATQTESTRLLPSPDAASATTVDVAVGKDIAAIIGKAMREQPAERYATAQDVKTDVENFLRRRPVLARGSGRAYRAGCFVARHRPGVAAATAAAAMLFAGLATVAWQSRVARSEAARAQAVQGFLVNLFDGLDPARGAGRDITVRELLARGERDATVKLESEPELKLVMLAVLGDIYNKLEYAQPAQRLQTARAALARRLHGEHSDAYDDALLGLATAGIGTRADLDSAEQQIHRVVAYRQQRYGAESPQTLDALHAEAKIDNLQGKTEQAVELYTRLHDAYSRLYGADSVDASRMRMGVLENRTGGGYAWRSVLADVLDVAAHVAEPNPGQMREWLSLQLDLGIALMYAGEWNQSEIALRRSIDGLDRLIGPENSESIDARRTLGVLYQDSGKFALALEQFRAAAAIAEHAYGANHSEAALNRGFQTRPLLWLGRYAEAEALQREVRDTIARSSSTEAVTHNGTRTTHASTLLMLGRYSEAWDEAHDVLADDRTVPARKLGCGYDLLIMGAADSERGNHERALAEIGEALAIMRKTGTQPSLHTAKALIAQALAEARAGAPSQKASAALEASREILRQRVGAEHPLFRVAELAECAGLRAAGKGAKEETLCGQAASALTQAGIHVPDRLWPFL